MSNRNASNSTAYWRPRARELAAVRPRLTAKAIGEVLGVAPRTVSAYLRSIGEPLTVEAVKVAPKRGRELQVKGASAVTFLFADSSGRSQYNSETVYATKGFPPGQTGDAIIAAMRKRLRGE